MKKVWDRMFRKFRALPVHPGIIEVARLLSERKAKHVLDLGCGMGRHTLYLARRGFDAYGLDSSPKALTHTLTMLCEEDLAAHLTIHDIKTLPYDDEYFDGVISTKVIHHNRLADVRRTACEIARVLKNRGLIWITVPARKNEPSRRQEEVEPGTFIPLDGSEKGVPHHYFAMEDLPALFPGFSVLDLRPDGGAYFSMLAEKVVP